MVLLRLPKLDDRPIKELVQKATAKGSPSTEEVINSISRTSRVDGIRARGLIAKDEGADLFKAGRFEDAREAYMKAIRATLLQDDQYSLPHTEVWIPAIRGVEMEQFCDVVACSNNVAQCYIREENWVKLSINIETRRSHYSILAPQALDWLEEVHCLYYTFGKGLLVPWYPWREYNPNFEEFVTARHTPSLLAIGSTTDLPRVQGRIKAFFRQASVYKALGNTGSAASTFVSGGPKGNSMLPKNPFVLDPSITRMMAQTDMSDVCKLRHPDPVANGDAKVAEETLQVRGAWKRLTIGSKKGQRKPGPRSHHTSGLVWRGTYYLISGINTETQELYHDAWALDLNNLQAGWRELPEMPIPYSMRNVRAFIYKDKIHFFDGAQNMFVFDLKKEQWSQLETSAVSGAKWADFWPQGDIRRFALELYGDKVYLFGGMDYENDVGRNATLCLDLKTLKWRMISGGIEWNDNEDLPGGRQYLASWLAEDRMYIHGGFALRKTAHLGDGEDTPFDIGEKPNHSYSDLWSLDLKGKTGWRKERNNGSVPAMRGEQGYGFNKKWNKAIVFGGCTEVVQWTLSNKTRDLESNFFADTFLWSPETHRWTQVVTRSFPCHRSRADIFVDDATGRTYFYGGYTHPMFTPIGGSGATRCFDDLWELTVDIPGGHFNAADFDPKSGSPNASVWKQCFNCGSVGDWMVCSGSCRESGTQAAFCSVSCQKAAWSEHKKRTGCATTASKKK